MLVVLMAAVILIVFVVSLNIGSLLLARASGRQQEMAVRAAIGASGGRMIRQMLTESLLLSVAGSVAGILVEEGLLSPDRPVSSYVPEVAESGVLNDVTSMNRIGT